jgi:hypothetical protein
MSLNNYNCEWNIVVIDLHNLLCCQRTFHHYWDSNIAFCKLNANSKVLSIVQHGLPETQYETIKKGRYLIEARGFHRGT